MTETNVHHDVLQHRRLIWLAIALLFLLPIGWLGMEIQRANWEQFVTEELEKQGCSIDITTVDVSIAEFYRRRLLFSLGVGTGWFPIGCINGTESKITDADLVWFEGHPHLLRCLSQ